MNTVKIKVTRKNGETIVTSDNGKKFTFSGNISDATALASVVYQSIYINFFNLEDVSDNFEISMSMDCQCHEEC